MALERLDKVGVRIYCQSPGQLLENSDDAELRTGLGFGDLGGALRLLSKSVPGFRSGRSYDLTSFNDEVE